MTSKSWIKCRCCDTADYTVRILWTDYYPEGSTSRDDHICLQCGLYVNGCGSLVGKESLIEYRRKYKHLLSRPLEDNPQQPKDKVLLLTYIDTTTSRGWSYSIHEVRRVSNRGTVTLEKPYFTSEGLTLDLSQAVEEGTKELKKGAR